MFARIKAKGLFRLFNINAVKIGVVCLADFGAMQFRSADKEVNKVLRTVKAGEGNETQQGSRLGFCLFQEFMNLGNETLKSHFPKSATTRTSPYMTLAIRS